MWTIDFWNIQNYLVLSVISDTADKNEMKWAKTNVNELSTKWLQNLQFIGKCLCQSTWQISDSSSIKPLSWLHEFKMKRKEQNSKPQQIPISKKNDHALLAFGSIYWHSTVINEELHFIINITLLLNNN